MGNLRQISILAPVRRRQIERYAECVAGVYFNSRPREEASEPEKKDNPEEKISILAPVRRRLAFYAAMNMMYSISILAPVRRRRNAIC